MRTFFFELCFMVIVLEYCPLGDVYNYLLSVGKLHDEEAAYIISSVMHGLNYLHNKHILHRDIKPENVLLSVHPRASLAKYTPRNLLIFDQTMKELQAKPDLKKGFK